ADISRIQASGGTNILAGLREAVDELIPARARKKHVILLSDGQSPYDEIPDLVDAAAAARITVSAVGVGDGAHQTLLNNIAALAAGPRSGGGLDERPRRALVRLLDPLAVGPQALGPGRARDDAPPRLQPLPRPQRARRRQRGPHHRRRRDRRSVHDRARRRGG